ncbi:MAG: glutathione peroxidase [Bacteroidales bacterium]|nr:glutathione peroxidase [Bacteroidales bacterium]
MKEIFNIKVLNKKGEEEAMSQYEGKVLLIVNTATGCGFTPQYEELEAMYEEFHDKGFEILDFPCNQFAGQTPGSDEEITQFCTLKFGTKFPQFKKIEVNGDGATPLFKYLKSQKGFEGFGNSMKALAMNAMLATIDKDYKNNPEIKWNFTKFLVDREGNVVARFEPTHNMKDVKKQVENLL